MCAIPTAVCSHNALFPSWRPQELATEVFSSSCYLLVGDWYDIYALLSEFVHEKQGEEAMPAIQFIYSPLSFINVAHRVLLWYLVTKKTGSFALL